MSYPYWVYNTQFGYDQPGPEDQRGPPRRSDRGTLFRRPGEVSFDFRPARLDILVNNLTDPDLSLIARQNERALTDIASLRDDMAVLTAMAMRLDGSHTTLLQETRATHAQIARYE